jgi:hypothetical protein
LRYLNWVGKLKHSKDKIEGIKWYEKPFKTLGVYFGNNKEECEKLNWENKIENIGMTNALIIIIFPRIVKFRFPQEKNKVFILSILFSQFNFSHSSLLK